MRFDFFRSMFILGLMASTVACQQITDSSLLSDSKSDPSSHVLNKEPQSSELYLKVYTPNIVAPPTADGKVDISGECYTSTYSQHSIIVLESGTGVQMDIVDLNPTTDVNIKAAICKNGKFNLALNTGALPVRVHRLMVVMQAIDNDGRIIRNDVQGVSNINLTKPSLPPVPQ